MNRDQIFQWIKKQYGTEADYPWNDGNAVLRHGDNNKWYGLIMSVGKDKLSLPGHGEVDVLNVKCDPTMVSALKTQEGFHPAYHMNKEKWITVRLDGSVPEDNIKNMLAISYELTNSKKK